MAALKIKARGRATAKPEAPKATTRPTRRGTRKSTTAKPAAKRTPAKRDSTKAKAAAAPAKRGPGRPRKAPDAPVQRRNSTGVDPRTEAKVLKMVEKMGERRAKAEAEHQEAINALHQAAQEALDVGVSMAKVSDASGISRQWLYKMGDFRGRGNGGSTPAPVKTPAKKAPAKAKATPAKRTTARKSTTTRQPAKATGSRRRVAIRNAG